MRDLFTPPNQRRAFLEGVVIVLTALGMAFMVGGLAGWLLRMWWVQ